MKHFLKNKFAKESLQRSLWLVVVISTLLLCRLFYIQVIDHKRYQTQSLNNRLDLEPTLPSRGIIYDRKGVIIADNVPSYQLAIVKEQTKHMDQLLHTIAKFVTLSEEDIKRFRAQLSKHAKFEPTLLKGKLTEKEAAALHSHSASMQGIRIIPTLLRIYPKGEAMAHVLGYVGQINQDERAALDSTNYRGTHWIGKTGFEKYAEENLHGQTGYRAIESNALGRSVRTLNETPAQSGTSYVLSIDSQLQQVAFDAIGKERGSIVAIDPNNGEVLAMVSKPSYDPNGFTQGLEANHYQNLQKKPGNPMVNRAIHGQYPQGSTIKPFMAMAGLESGVINQATTIDDPGHFQIPHVDHLYRDWLPKGHGRVNAAKSLIVSCDVFYYQLAYKLGMQRMSSMFESFGFGKPTGIEMPNEYLGIVPTPDWKYANKGERWYTGDTILSGIGQGYMLATPLQLAHATAIFSAQGKNFKPTLIHEIIDQNGKHQAHPPEFISSYKAKHSSNWGYLSNAMHKVVVSKRPRGTGYRFGTDTPYTAAAKTGTVQVYRPKGGIFVPQPQLPKHLRDHALFIAFAPIKQPKIAVAVVIEHASSTVSARAARKVIDQYLLGERHAQ